MTEEFFPSEWNGDIFRVLAQSTLLLNALEWREYTRERRRSCNFEIEFYCFPVDIIKPIRIKAGLRAFILKMHVVALDTLISNELLNQFLDR